MTVDISTFAAAEDSFLLRFQRDDLPGLLSKKLTVPVGTLALVRAGDGDDKVLEPGTETSELETVILVKDRFPLELAFDAGRSKDNMPCTFQVELDLRPGNTVIDFTQLETCLLRDGPQADRGAVVSHFRPYVQEAVRYFVSSRDAKALCAEDQRSELTTHLREELKKALFETGMRLEDVLHPTFTSEGFEAHQAAVAAADAQAQELDRQKDLIELKKGLDKHALLMDIEIRDEADRARKDKRLARYEELRTKMGDDDIKALVMMLDDDQQRAALIRELIEKDMTPEQRATLKVSEMEGRVEERLKELQQKLAQLTGAELQRSETDPITKRVVCVVGKRLLAFDPKTNLHPEVPKEVYDTEGGGLGYLRSVRAEIIDGEEYLLAGAQRGVYRINGTIRHEHPFPVEPKGKGGANAVCYFDGRIFATHSEVGLIEWPLDGEGRLLCVDVAGKANSVRGAMVHGGILYFSAGADIFALDVATGSESPQRYRGSDDSITSFIVVEGELVAGNRSGKLFRWSLDDPNSPEAFGVIKKNPIFMLRHTLIAGQAFYVVGSKDFTVTAAEPRKDLYREYQAREEVRWVDAAADFVFGVSRSGYKVFCWDSHKQSSPVLTIRVSDKVQDLSVIKMLPTKA
jgi:hypothetical protein